MLKAGGLGEKNGKPVRFMVVGLSHENLRRLKAGQPIKCAGSEFGLAEDIEILIFAGKDERTMGRDLAELIGPETRTKIDPRFRD